MTHKLAEAPIRRSRHHPFGYAVMLCDPAHSSMGTDHIERVDCPDCLALMKEFSQPEPGRNAESDP